MILLLISSICLLYMNFRSLQLQALVKFELTKGELTAPASLFVAGFPFVPNVSVEGEPISVLKARYLINERRFTEAIDILKKDGSSPWETHREYFLSLTYNLTGNSDSAIAYGMKVFRQKPLYTANLDTLCRILENREHYTQADSVIGDYLAVFDGMGFSLAGFIAAYGDPRSKYINWQTELRRKAAIQRVEIYYYPALNEFNQKNYAGAADKYTKIVKLEPGLTEAWEKRAWCWFYLNEPKKCLSDLDTVMARGVKDPVLEELKKSVTHLTK